MLKAVSESELKGESKVNNQRLAKLNCYWNCFLQLKAMGFWQWLSVWGMYFLYSLYYSDIFFFMVSSQDPKWRKCRSGVFSYDYCMLQQTMLYTIHLQPLWISLWAILNLHLLQIIYRILKSIEAYVTFIMGCSNCDVIRTSTVQDMQKNIWKLSKKKKKRIIFVLVSDHPKWAQWPFPFITGQGRAIEGYLALHFKW